MSNQSIDNIASVDTQLQPGTVFVQDCTSGKVSNLYQLDLTTGKAELVGAITNDVYDIAFVGSQLYGLDQEKNQKTTRLVKIDPATGEATVVGDIGFYVVGLAYNRERDTLYASAAKQLIAIDPETGRGKPAIKVSRGERGCGEIAFDENGRAYITLIGPDRKKLLASCNLDTNKVKIIGDIYKGAMKGIKVICSEESYTSKASFLSLDYIPSWGDENAKQIKF
nr:hypothetical protein [Xenococcaceae cyanobacterium MO_188.B32]